MALEKIKSFEYPVIDMDCHIVEPPVIFSEYLEPKWRELARQMLSSPADKYGLGYCVRGEYPKLGNNYRMFLETDETYNKTNPNDQDYYFPGTFDGAARLGCMDAEGIDKGIVRNTFMAGIFHLPSPDLVNALCQAYNKWVHDYCSADPTRLLPEALLPCGDMPAAIRELERTAKMGFKGAVVRGSTAGLPLSDPHYDPLWARMQELGWPLCIHSAFDACADSSAQWLCMNDKLSHPESGGAFFSTMINLNFMLDNIVTLGEITLGGMCDKFPKLNVYFIEAGHSWIGEVLYRLDKGFQCKFAGRQPSWWQEQRRIPGKTLPSEIFERQIYVPFEGGDQHYMSNMGMTALAKNLIWASDIPHWDADGPWEGVGALRALKVAREVECTVMGGNAAKILNVPLEKKVGTSDKAKKIAA